MPKGKQTTVVTRQQAIQQAMPIIEEANRGEITETLWESVADLVKEWTPAKIADDAREIVLAVEDVAASMAVWKQEMQYGVDEFQTSLREISRSLAMLQKCCERDTTQRLLEPIAELVRQGVNNRLIAKKYGWRLANGEPNVLKVAQQIHEQSPAYLHGAPSPDQPQPLIENIDERWEERAADIARDEQEKRDASEAEGNKRSVAALLSEGVSGAQIQKIHPSLSMDQLQYRADRLGFRLVKTYALEFDPGPKKKEPVDWSKYDFKPRLPLEGKIEALRDQGLNAAQIVEGLRLKGSAVTIDSVAEVIFGKHVNESADVDDENKVEA